MNKQVLNKYGVPSTIFVSDGTEFGLEEQGMLQAFYSRSVKSIEDRIESLGSTSDKIKESLKRFYISYGHKSIGQGADVIMFFEDVSIFAAKCIQNNALYRGQETSTRYFDFASRPFINPLGIEGFQERVISLYSDVNKYVFAALKADAGEGVTDAALKAKAFDVSRAFLTAGFTTKLSWVGNFDNVQDHLSFLMHSPAGEIRSLACSAFEQLHEMFPNIVREPSAMYSEEYLHKVREHALFFDDAIIDACDRDEVWQTLTTDETPAHYPEFFYSLSSTCRPNELPMMDFLASRNPGEIIPRNAALTGSFTFNFNIDYGSYRDLQRHRNGICMFPSFRNSVLEISPWYMDQLKDLDVLDAASTDTQYGLTLADQIENLFDAVRTIRANIKDANQSEEALEAMMMYYTPMGVEVRTIVRYDLPQAIYVAELRSKETVHATARLPAQRIARAIQEEYPNVKLYVDFGESKVSNKRGEQTIKGTDGVSINETGG